MREPIPRVGVLRAWRFAAAVNSPAAAVGDAGELLDVDMDQLAWPITLMAADWFSCCAVT